MGCRWPRRLFHGRSSRSAVPMPIGYPWRLDAGVLDGTFDGVFYGTFDDKKGHGVLKAYNADVPFVIFNARTTAAGTW